MLSLKKKKIADKLSVAIAVDVDVVGIVYEFWISTSLSRWHDYFHCEQTTQIYILFISMSDRKLFAFRMSARDVLSTVHFHCDKLLLIKVRVLCNVENALHSWYFQMTCNCIHFNTVCTWNLMVFRLFAFFFFYLFLGKQSRNFPDRKMPSLKLQSDSSALCKAGARGLAFLRSQIITTRVNATALIFSSLQPNGISMSSFNKHSRP